MFKEALVVSTAKPNLASVVGAMRDAAAGDCLNLCFARSRWQTFGLLRAADHIKAWQGRDVGLQPLSRRDLSIIRFVEGDKNGNKSNENRIKNKNDNYVRLEYSRIFLSVFPFF